MTRTLDALTLPLRGSHLIEASAGTGKTWTIAALYLRLVLGHGDDDSRAPCALSPAQILVMTFTRAATRELSARIRERLIEAARLFRDPAALAASGDAFLRKLAEKYADDAARSQAAHRLALAAEVMDEAAVHTIDAWCQRMLREHAFDSGSLFSEELVADERELQAQAVLDVWRREVYPLPMAALERLHRVWPEAEVMGRQIGPLLMHEELLGAQDGAQALPDWLPGWVEARRDALAQLKQGWAERADAMFAWIFRQQNGPKPPFNAVKVNPKSLEKWHAQIVAWAEDPLAERLVLDPDSGRKRLRPEGLLDALKKNHDCGAIPAEFAEFEALMGEIDALEPLAPRLLRHATRRVAQRIEQLKRAAAQFGFADLQRRLEQALAGPAGARLREGILAQYPVALIDEFQDTSPLQYRLFDRLYRVAEDDPATALLMIGDPKQSIYRFRGADIYSYLAVRRATVGRHHTLGTNRRSTHAMVGAVNAVFSQAERQRASGAFALGRAASAAGEGAGSHALPFEPVSAHGRTERLDGPAGRLPALQVELLPTPLPAEALREALAQRAATRIVDWLDDPQVGFRTEGAQPSWRRLAPGDIAVLVRHRREAEAVRRALRRAGVASVYLSDQDSVFDTAEACDLLRWLQAVASPLDTRLARAAFATATAGLSLDELARLVHDDAAWDVRLEMLRDLRHVWQRHGVLTLVRQTLHRLDLPARWLAGQAVADGERRLTNLLHLGELLQSASSRLDGEQAQIRWLAEQIAADHGSSDERVVRLESDAELVQVVTVHKSKGLEYPVVVMPFAASARPVKKGESVFVERIDEAGLRRLDFELDEDALAEADRERLREDLRLFYVALTRPRHLLWLGVGLAHKPRSQDGHLLHQSALGHLLGEGQPLTPDQVFEALSRWAEEPAPAQGQAVEPGSIQVSRMATEGPRARLQRRAPVRSLADLPDYTGQIDDRWAVSSFTALVRDMKAAAPGEERAAMAALLADARRQEQVREEWAVQPADALEGPAARPARDAVAEPAWHGFESGALAGNFLHELLQLLAQEGFARQGEEAVRRMARRRCERAGHPDERADAVLDWMAQVLDTPLPPLGGTPLAEIVTLQPEMEFWMPCPQLDSAAFDRLSRQALLPGQARPALVARQLDGMMMGFIDLVFEHEGRWWLIDYKSNRLGTRDADYDRATLEHAVLTHRYELQSLLYLLALHRLLRSRLGAGYDPQAHLGGAICLFLRGIQGPERGCVLLRPPTAMLEALDRALGPTPGDLPS
ncbi:MAG: exodeoxyribonuclease subunit beta [Pseudomonadota bacterium]|jgi:exodeoxyribonuclease V beta subunit